MSLSHRYTLKTKITHPFFCLCGSTYSISPKKKKSIYTFQHIYMKFIREAFVCENRAFSPKHPDSSCTKESRGWATPSESKEQDWLKHILKYHNYYHSHRKSAEKVTWQITQIGNSAGCSSWQWPIRKIKDEWRLILA